MCESTLSLEVAHMTLPVIAILVVVSFLGMLGCFFRADKTQGAGWAFAAVALLLICVGFIVAGIAQVIVL